MRGATVALAVIPVLLGGLGIAIAAGAIDPLDPFATTAEDTPTGPVTNADAVSDESDPGTPIDGQRPHLSVIDGHANLYLPVPLPEILSLLPGGGPDLNPLPPVRGDGDIPPTTSADTGDRQPEPSAGSDARSGTRSSPGAAQLPEPPDGELPAASPLTPDAPASRPFTPDSLPPHAKREPRFDRDLPHTTTGEKMNNGRPPHADTQGRPPHAGQTGRPDHAGGEHTGNRTGMGNGSPGKAATGNRPDHAGTTGRPDHAGTTGRPDHAGTTGRPDHAGGNGRHSDESHPGPR